ncbi:hypothetical protein COU79_00700 [Candidatus Peregrinibacteria bacterium CG10_big_fil_rev_8_21_14_0_10_54_7]|nr:MAG: hypothetical protein COU79_00700 [Candidatus Peregrinibacteria bacterium CG10_big_fil_rev_8_21_14_0_10_54_7]
MKKFAPLHWLPELLLLLLGGYFCLRELGTFPAAWTDDSLFMIVARQVADGRGYTLPLLDHEWAYPYILAVGPTLILPVALSIKLLGFSIEAARIPMVLYIAATAVTFYLLVYRMSDRNRNVARWSTALLLSLSAFINTGKPVMGEVPGFFFLLLGLLLLTKEKRSWKTDLGIGLCFGLSVLTKLTYGLLYPALGFAWIVALCRRDWKELFSLTGIGIVAVLVFLPWRFLEMSSSTGLSRDFAFMFGSDDGTGFQILNGNMGLLLRPQYLYYAAMLLLGSFGLWFKTRKISWSVWTIITSLIMMITLYFLSSFGWYRHLLPAHLLLIPFVVIAVSSTLPKKIAVALLLFFILVQGYWQWDYRGSSRSTAAAEAAEYIEEHLQSRNLIIQVAPVYVRLEQNPNWYFLTNPILTSRLPKELVTFSGEHRCTGLLRGWEEGDKNRYTIAGKYVLIPPPKNECP